MYLNYGLIALDKNGMGNEVSSDHCRKRHVTAGKYSTFTWGFFHPEGTEVTTEDRPSKLLEHEQDVCIVHS
jgi:hypothetical protein